LSIADCRLPTFYLCNRQSPIENHQWPGVDMLKDVIAILASTPEKLKREIASMSLQEMKTRPAANKWSVQEVLAHLDDIEEIGMRARVAAMVETENPILPSIDQEKRAEDMKYNRKNPLRSLASLSRQRRANLKWLKKLRPAQLKRRGIHRKVGVISVEELVTEWAFHDLGHLKQILEIKRYALYPRIGNMRAFYKLS
jgi:uncharacterized damage-inducible protein DinB